MKLICTSSLLCLAGLATVASFCYPYPLSRTTTRHHTSAVYSPTNNGQIFSDVVKSGSGAHTTRLYLSLSQALRSPVKSAAQRVKGRFSKINGWKTSFFSKLKRVVLLVGLVAAFWFTTSGMTPLPAQASSTVAPTPTVQERVVNAMPKGDSLDTMVDKYVQQHMFDDEAYDPTTSAYREAYADNTVGAYPSALREATSSVLGEAASSQVLGTQATQGQSLLTKTLRPVMGLLARFGLSETAAVGLLTTIVFLAFPIVFVVGLMTMSLAFKQGIRREMKARYGDDYTLDATIKTEEDVEAPEDDDDDDEDDEDDDEEEGGKR